MASFSQHVAVVTSAAAYVKCQSRVRFLQLSLPTMLVLLLLQVCLWATATSASALPQGAAVAISEGHESHAQHHYHHSLASHQHRRRQQRDNSAKNWNVLEQCGAVRGYFESIDIKLDGVYEEKGAICGGNCCSNATETELRHKATAEFERLLHHHTKSLRSKLVSTANLFQNHVLELAEQSENKTLNVFSQVYRQMGPLSRKLIHQLYAELINHLKNPDSHNLNNLEQSIHKFFVELFPVAYHQAVHLNKLSDNTAGDLHEDYINCLKHTYDDLQPFGSIPKEIKQNLLQSVQTAQIFMNSLLQSAEVLSETDELYGTHLTSTCKQHLLKMHYCPSCNGLQKTQVKTCYGYCINVLRGCSAQYAGVLDAPWSNVVDAIDNLVTTHIRSDSGIITTIKQLDAKLSEAIMRAMENGPDLEKKVIKTCGTSKLFPSLNDEKEVRTMTAHSVKWATPADAEILRFLSTIDKSKEFYSKIVNNVCEDEDIQRTNNHCWTGVRVGDYTQLIMTSGTDTQRYNPEVPLEVNAQTNKLNELVDKLIKIRKNIGSAMPSTIRAYSDIQSDMARHDEEGSGRITDDVDDEEYGIHGSGDGSGDGEVTPNLNPIDTTHVTSNTLEPRSAATRTTSLFTAFKWCPIGALIASLVTIYATSSRRSSWGLSLLAL